jgi:hypothetical protein
MRPAWTASSTPPTPNAATSVDLDQAGLIELPELQRRAAYVEYRRCDLAERRDALTAQRDALTRDNQLRRRVRDFASRILAVIDTLDFDQKQTLLRLVVEEVHVTGWHIRRPRGVARAARCSWTTRYGRAASASRAVG